jgi:hypothetical protein
MNFSSQLRVSGMKIARWIFFALFSITACPAILFPNLNSSPSAQSASVHSTPEHYLLLVNTAIAFMMDELKFRQFDKSSYDGIAVAFLHAYDTSAVPSVASMNTQIKGWKKYTKKDIWPWVYLNRMIGFNPAENNSHADTPYFRTISGADLNDANGARSDFLSLWRNSLAAARDSHAPGIVCDLEFYNYYKEYDIGELARKTAKTPAEAVKSLQEIGAEMARIAAEEYPDAVLWFLVTGFTHAGYKTLDGVSYYPSPTYVAIGLLDEISRKHLRLKVLAGGEGSLAYCHETLQQFKSAILERQADMASTLQKYKGVLEMAGTLTLWSDRAAKSGWVNEEACKAATAETVEDLQPYIELVMNSYRYNWIYASSEGNYLPFAPGSAPRFDAVIARAKTHANAGTLH